MKTTIKAEPHPIDSDDMEWLVIESEDGSSRTRVRVPKGDATEIVKRVCGGAMPKPAKCDRCGRENAGGLSLAKVCGQCLWETEKAAVLIAKDALADMAMGKKPLPTAENDSETVSVPCPDGRPDCLVDHRRRVKNDSETAKSEEVKPVEFLVPRFICPRCLQPMRVTGGGIGMGREWWVDLECGDSCCAAELGRPIWSAKPAKPKLGPKNF